MWAPTCRQATRLGRFRWSRVWGVDPARGQDRRTGRTGRHVSVRPPGAANARLPGDPPQGSGGRRGCGAAAPPAPARARQLHVRVRQQLTPRFAYAWSGRSAHTASQETPAAAFPNLWQRTAGRTAGTAIAPSWRLLLRTRRPRTSRRRTCRAPRQLPGRGPCPTRQRRGSKSA